MKRLKLVLALYVFFTVYYVGHGEQCPHGCDVANTAARWRTQAVTWRRALSGPGYPTGGTGTGTGPYGTGPYGTGPYGTGYYGTGSYGGTGATGSTGVTGRRRRSASPAGRPGSQQAGLPSK